MQNSIIEDIIIVGYLLKCRGRYVLPGDIEKLEFRVVLEKTRAGHRLISLYPSPDTMNSARLRAVIYVAIKKKYPGYLSQQFARK